MGRFSCAGINNQSNAFNFHGDRRIWDGSTIRRNIRGNSVLYIVMSEPPYGMCYVPKFLFLFIERQCKLLD